MLLKAHPFCIFCGGVKSATSIEHCPPRAAFTGRHAPEGFEFPACQDCNGGTSDEDLLVAFLSHMDPVAQTPPANAGLRLAHAVKRQLPGVLPSMAIRSAIEARQAARSLGIEPEPGQTYQDLPLAKIPPELHEAVKTLAGKLTKATYFMKTGRAFPLTGGILFHWFTNAALLPPGRGVVPALEVFGELEAEAPALKRNGNDLSDQFGLRLSLKEDAGEDLFVVQAVFRRSFGFVCIAATKPGQAAEILDTARAQSGKEPGPFELL